MHNTITLPAEAQWTWATVFRICGAVCLGGTFLYLRLNLNTKLINIDEDIPLRVSAAMTAMGVLDPNWELTDLAPWARVPQYNFYSYNLASHAMIRAGRLIGIEPIIALRLANLLYQGLAITALVSALRNVGANERVLWVATTLLVITPALVQDAHMARPESFLYLLFALTVLVATLRINLLPRAIIVGVIVGIGATCKITFLIAGLILLPLLWPLNRKAIVAAISAVAATLVSFVAVAPYIVIHWDVFVIGINALLHQYSTGHPPHSPPTRSIIESTFWSSEFFLKVYGPLIPVALMAPLAWEGMRRAMPIGLWLAVVVTSIYFIPMHVFFERNMSIAVLAAVILVALLAERGSFALVVIVLCAAPMAYWSIQTAHAARYHQVRFQVWYANNIHEPVTPVVPYWTHHKIEVGPCVGLLEVLDFGDPFSRLLIDGLERDGYEVVARYKSRFAMLPGSTFHTYLDEGALYYRCKP